MIRYYFELPTKQEIQFGGSTYLSCLALPSIILWNFNFFHIWYEKYYPASVRLSVVFLDVEKTYPGMLPNNECLADLIQKILFE